MIPGFVCMTGKTLSMLITEEAKNYILQLFSTEITRFEVLVPTILLICFANGGVTAQLHVFRINKLMVCAYLELRACIPSFSQVHSLSS